MTYCRWLASFSRGNRPRFSPAPVCTGCSAGPAYRHAGLIRSHPASQTLCPVGPDGQVDTSGRVGMTKPMHQGAGHRLRVGVGALEYRLIRDCSVYGVMGSPSRPTKSGSVRTNVLDRNIPSLCAS
jgi:hypothetical protein